MMKYLFVAGIILIAILTLVKISKVSFVDYKEIDERRQQICYDHFQTFEYKIFKDKLFCKVDNKWLEIAKGE